MPRRVSTGPKTLAEVVGDGDRAASLVALRDTLARTIESAEPQHVAALAKQLTAVLAELDALSPATEGSALDDLARRRADRRAAPSA